MGSLRYVCLSDMHLGAEYSILTPISEAGTFVEHAGDCAAEPFTHALRAYVRCLAPPEKPTLILLGDVLDLAFSPTHVAAMAYRRFARALFPPGEEPVFAPTILYLPGNHDHHLWRTLQDESFLQQIPDARKPIPRLVEVTPMMVEPPREEPFAEAAGGPSVTAHGGPSAPLGGAGADRPGEGPPPPLRFAHDPRSLLESRFLTEVLRRSTGHESLTVRTAYPNLGFLSDDGGRCVVLHHGHFVEPLYTAVSRLRAAFSGHASIPGDVATLEAENGGWVDYFWSELGSAGAVGYDTVKLYQALQDPGATRATTLQAARHVTKMLMGRIPGSGMPAVRDLTERMTKALVGALLGSFASSERYAFDSVLSEGTLATLRWYLQQPVRRQLAHELGTVPGDVTFVFGHTHKPFEDRLPIEGWERPLGIFNTGGWVLDESRMPATQGGAAVFIDDELNVASLRLFQCDPARWRAPVAVHGVLGPRDPSAWVRALRRARYGTRRQWRAFSRSAYGGLDHRSEVISDRFFNRWGHPQIPAPLRRASS